MKYLVFASCVLVGSAACIASSHDTPDPPGSSDAPDPSPSGEQCTGPKPQPTDVCAIGCGPPVPRIGDRSPPYWIWAPRERVRDGYVYPCPICLPANARIAAPGGDVRASEVREGMLVYTADASGNRLAALVVEVGSTRVGPEHALARVVLDDGRVARASPKHPTSDGRALGALRLGDWLGSAVVVRAELERYGGERTFDLLPAGATGTYWADGVLLGSTLTRRGESRFTTATP